MNRLEAMAMLKELVEADLVEPSYIQVMLRKPEHYQVKIRCDYNKTEIEKHAKEHGLTIIEDKKRKYLVIYKP